MADRAAVHSLHRFELAVPDLAEARHFYGAFGLDVGEADGSLSLRTAGSAHVWARLVWGRRKRLKAIDFAIDAADKPAFADRIGMDGTGRIETATPDGVPVRIVVAPKTTLNAKASFAIAGPAEAGPRGARPRSGTGLVRPRRLAHISLFVRDLQQSIDFFTDRLGLRLSDRSGDDVAFLHAPYGCDHHLVALARSNGPGLHHCSWDVGTLAEIGLGAMQMEQAGYTRGWGLGRHVLGSNYFHYVRDPWGSYSEYSADMDYIPAGLDWQAGDHPGEDSFYQWGPPPPEDFIVNHEMAA